MEKSFRMELAGRPLIVETGKMAKQASGAVWSGTVKPWFL